MRNMYFLLIIISNSHIQLFRYMNEGVAELRLTRVKVLFSKFAKRKPVN